MKRINRFFSGLEWRWSLGAAIWGLLFPATSFALPAWAAKATGMLSQYAPFSWVAIGFSGLLLYAICVALYGFGVNRAVRSRYDAKFMKETGGVDPLSKVFENRRIYLNDLVLPSNPRVNAKTFVGCEIVGPANMYLEWNNNINKNESGTIDAVMLSGERPFYNGISFTDCVFKDCTFHRVTIFMNPNEVAHAQSISWLNWITHVPQQPQLNSGKPTKSIEDQSDQSPQEIEEKKQR